ncbi:hypothetical protein BDB00DRAFT_866391 [Zychaea mexicana]|uniref:uncharacterized protein n=1 Tax=Zychaea mexicana TaxID=64656 RepID=UPI0022FED7ED|nr:uncharacterized protein BDB00DRAFT_866391 [Zychaea mexicana]KAI9499518.1 hypothetical protein BDB00DRAFT_866391 [Zychaea mexicana]
MSKDTPKNPPIKPVAEERLRERYQRRLSTPGSLAPNLRSRQIHLLTWAIAIPLSGYVVLFADFGPEDHCFSPLRRWFNAKRSQFWTLSDKEKEDLKNQGRLK